MDLGEKLRFLTGENDEYAPLTEHESIEDKPDTVTPPSIFVDDDPVPEELSIDRYLRLDSGKSKAKPKKQRPTLFDEFDEQDEEDLARESRRVPKKIKSEKLYRKITKRMSEDMISDFEDFLSDDGLYEDETSDELRNGLISLGRKYARATSTTAENAEIERTFAGSEEKLKTIYDDITRDVINVGKDIDQMRASTRGKNYKAISELVSSKTSLHQARIQAVKEMNNIRKSQFEMRMKEKARETGADGSADISPNSIKSLFGAGRSQLMQATGGYATLSGASYDEPSNFDMSDEEIEAAYFADDQDDTDEGDRYLEYEHLDPKSELVVDDSGSPVEIRVVDRDGNLIPDYPIPNMDELHFEINKTTGEALDDFHRTYKVVQA